MNIFTPILSFFDHLHHFLWSPAMLATFFAIGCSYTIQTHFFQFHFFSLWWKNTIGSLFSSSHHKKNTGSVSPFAAMSAALAGSMGIGNIAGVATALVAGGPGAIFWMWISALLGMMTKYAEILLGLKFRFKDKNQQWFGGPMVYLKEGLHSPFLSAFFSICCLLASFGMGNMTQSNSMADVLSHTLHIPPFYTGILTAVITAVVILGGMNRIATISSILIPFMSILYLFFSFIVICANITSLPFAFFSIFQYAFRPSSITGGAAGYCMMRALRLGVSRGVFSNEAGLGSSVMAHASSSVSEPVIQGMWGIFEVFVDTIVVCTITALVLLTSGVYNVSLYETALLTKASLPNGVVLASQAFSSVLGNFGESFVAFSTVIFAFATLIAWAHYGQQCSRYLFGEKSIFWYKLLFLCFIIIGCLVQVEVVWEISDTFNALMAVPNLIALAFLSHYVIEDTNRYLANITIFHKPTYHKKS